MEMKCKKINENETRDKDKSAEKEDLHIKKETWM